jgi:mannose-6-phosphate isomerase
MRPIVLAPNLPETFYRGSGRISRFRQTPIPGPPRPEDWIASTTPRHGLFPSGLTVLDDGTTLAEAVAADPLGWLGAGGSGSPPGTGMLVKLLDAGQRLPVHVHPSRDFALSHLGVPHGKTEAWVVLEAEPGAAVHMGFRRDVDPGELSHWVRTQDVEALLDVTHRLPVAPGDAILCPAGMPHAIGEGVLLLEVQEPTDLSVLLEWEGFSAGPPAATCGMPLVEALGCVDLRACSPERLTELRTAAEGSLLPAEAAEVFRLDLIADGPVESGFGVLVVLDGNGDLTGGWGSVPLTGGTAVVIPAAAGECRLTGDIRAIRCRPALTGMR